MSATGGAGLGKLTEIADNTDELESIASGIGISINDPGNGYGLYAALDDDTTTYILHQNTAGAWICQKIIDSSGLVTFAKGSTDAPTNWTNRASLSYDTYDNTFS